MDIEPLDTWFSELEHPLVIAGPCSAETEQQVLATATAVASVDRVRLFQAGIWKPRTRPGGFEGLGRVALPWLAEAKLRTGLATSTEVARAEHVEAALEHGIDVLWIGARTTGNPFSVQELAEALRGVDAAVMVKNPISPDLGLWSGAFERLAAVGIRKLGAIHRGFALAESKRHRYSPMWRIPLELIRRLPGLPLISDPSHMTGHRGAVGEAAQEALDLGVQGLMVETHICPEKAWTDAEQQVTPGELAQILGGLTYRRPRSINGVVESDLEILRKQIDEVDTRILDALQARMEVVRQIACTKLRGGVTALQFERLKVLLEKRIEMAVARGLPASLVEELYQVIHEAAVMEQAELMAAAAATGSSRPDVENES
jgi:chorismate mutase